MSDNETDKRVYEIMALIGVNPHDYSRAAANFRRLPVEELDARLARLRAEEQEINAWRNERGAAWDISLSPANFITIIDKQQILIDRKVGELGRLVASLRRLPRIPRAVETAVVSAIDQIEGLRSPSDHSWATAAADYFGGKAAHGVDEVRIIRHLGEVAYDNERKLQAIEEARQAIETGLGHPILWSDDGPFTGEDVVQALARMENEVDRRKPDLLVAINEGGLAISEIVSADLGLSIPIAKVHSLAGKIDFSEIVPTYPKIICVIGHVAWSGETMAQVIDHLSGVYRADYIFGAVLMTSTSALERLRARSLAFHQMTEATTFHLTSDPAAGVAVEVGRYTIGTGSQTLNISRDTLRLARSEIAARQSNTSLWN